MDISALTSQQASLSQQIQFAVLGKVRDINKSQGDAAVKLLEAAAQVQKQSQQPASPEGIGTKIDITA